MRNAQNELFKKYSMIAENQLIGKPLYEKTIDGKIIAPTCIRKIIGKTSYNVWVVEDDERCIAVLGVTAYLSREDAENESNNRIF